MNHQFLNHTLDSNTHNDEENEDKIDTKAFSKRSFTFRIITRIKTII